MLWIFEKTGKQKRCEIRREGSGEGTGYEMIVTNEDGSQRMERFDDPTELVKRSMALPRDRLESGWRQPK